MHEINLLTDIAIIFAFSVSVILICHRVGLPILVGFLITGALIGPHGLGLVSSLEEVKQLAEIGVILLLFTIGIEFSLRTFARQRRAVLIGGGLQVALTIGFVWLLLNRMGFDSHEGLFFGMLVALSSTAVVMKVLQERSEIDSVYGKTVMSILIFQDLAIVPMVLLAPLLAGTELTAGPSVAVIFARVLIVVIGVFVLSRWIVPYLLTRVVRTRIKEMFLLSVALICIGIAWGTAQLGLSLGLGAFLAGLVISESEYAHQALDGVLPLRDVFNSFFFVSVGMLLDTNLIVDSPLLLIGGALGLMLVKCAVATGVGLVLRISVRSSLLTGLALCQVGEFSFILAESGFKVGLVQPETYQLFIGAVVITMAATPFIIKLAPSMVARVLSMRISMPAEYVTESDSDEPLASILLKDHLIVVGFGLNGHNVAQAAKVAKIPYYVMEMNVDTVSREREIGEPIHYCDATSEAALARAGVDRARVLVVTIAEPSATRQIISLARHRNKSIHIIVRTRYQQEMEGLYRLGASEVIPEEFETSVEIFVRVMRKYLVPHDEIDTFTSEIRSQGYEMFRSLHPGQGQVSIELSLSDTTTQTVRIKPESPAVGKTLEALALRQRCGTTVLAIQRKERTIANPPGDQEVESEDSLLLLGTTEQITRAAGVLRGKG